MVIDPQTPLEEIIGVKIAKRLRQAFNILTVQDLLDHAPRRYAQHGFVTPFENLPVGEEVTVFARVVSTGSRRMQKKSGNIFEVVITDGLKEMTLAWFNQPWRATQISAGREGFFAGKVDFYRNKYQLTHPDFQLVKADTDEPQDDVFEWAEKPIPIYPGSAKIATWRVKAAIEKVLSEGEIDDPIPEWVFKAPGFGGALGLDEAYRRVHTPKKKDDWLPGLYSLKLREAFELQLGLTLRKRQLGSQRAVARPKSSMGLLDHFDKELRYTLTTDQLNVGAEISADLSNAHPMHRLLQGEVGSGKTLVALRAMLQIADQGGQSALLAPTEVLASQHLRSIKDLLGEKLVQLVAPVLVTGQMPTKERKSALLDIVSGQAKIIVGTHALMSETTVFHDLGLVVIDEQHRFGVEQRDALRKKGITTPHTLVMTATPIPRTIALTAFGDLDISTIKELPKGRAEIISHVVPTAEHPAWLERTWQRAAEEIEKGRQVYVVCPAISAKKTEEDTWQLEESQAGSQLLEPQRTLYSVEETLELIRQHPALKKYRAEGLSGDIPAAEKESRMLDFESGDTKILVSTTVIEVGVDVPNASMMIVLDADRFGMSQLHQLRGRVGRGEHPGLALFVTPAQKQTPARERVETVAQNLDGFILAQKDLEYRRAGDVLGSTQSGSKSSLKWLKVIEDQEIIETGLKLVRVTLEADPQLRYAPQLRKKIEQNIKNQEINRLNKS